MNVVKVGMKFRHIPTGDVFVAVKPDGIYWKCERSGKVTGESRATLDDDVFFLPIAPAPRVPKVGETWIKPAGTNEPRKLTQWEALQVAAQMSDGAVWTYVSGPDDAQADMNNPQHFSDAERAQAAKPPVICERAWMTAQIERSQPSTVALSKAREPWVDSLPIDWWLPDA